MSDDSLPNELEEQCTQCHKSLAGIEKLLKPLMTINRLQLEERLSSLDAASQTLLLAYTMNSLFWTYLATQGVDPKTHLVKQELERIQRAMKRARIVGEKGKEVGARVDSKAAKRFIRSALWDSEDKDKTKESKKRQVDGSDLEKDVPNSKRTK